jgi:hypothetical protein
VCNLVGGAWLQAAHRESTARELVYSLDERLERLTALSRTQLHAAESALAAADEKARQEVSTSAPYQQLPCTAPSQLEGSHAGTYWWW